MKIGVLIIGSLYWDDLQHRTDWRRNRLDCGRWQRVRVPIRYGRRSRCRGDSYTMVFSPGLCEDQFGSAITIPFKSDNLLEEAERLWAAEDRVGRGLNGCISARWGCVALLEHPEAPLTSDVREGWTKRVKLERRYLKLADGHYEAAAVDKCGFLGIRWPRTEKGSLLEMDALLATATCPTFNVCGDYPSPPEIAEAWDTVRGRKETKYFWRNRAHRITTFQDADIKDKLLELGLTPR